MCLGPADWLLVSQMHFATEVSAQGLALVELTDGVAGLAVTGSAVRELLAKGCGLDLHPRSFPAGRCARTRFAQIPLVMDCLEASRFELYAARSYEHYLHAWLDDAAREFAVG